MDNEKERLKNGIKDAVGTYILVSIIIIVLSSANFLIGLGFAEALGIIFFIPGILVFIVSVRKDKHFAKGFLMGSFIPMAIAILAFGGCSLLFMTNTFHI